MAAKMTVFCGSDSPEKAYPPFMLGLGASAAGFDVMLFFTMSGLNIIRKGGAEKCELPGAPMPLQDFVKTALEQGIRFVACSAAFPIVGMKQEDLIEGITVGGIATFVNEAKDADIVLTF